MGSVSSSKVKSVDKLLKERNCTMRQLREQLIKAQEKFHRFAEENERLVFGLTSDYSLIGSSGCQRKWAVEFAILWPLLDYRKDRSSSGRRKEGSLIHPVFHVSQLKRRTGKGKVIAPALPMLGPGSQFKVMPEKMLDRRIIKRRKKALAQVLIKWSNLDELEATWEDYSWKMKQFSFLSGKQFVVEGRVSGLGGILSKKKRMFWERKGSQGMSWCYSQKKFLVWLR